MRPVRICRSERGRDGRVRGRHQGGQVSSDLASPLLQISEECTHLTEDVSLIRQKDEVVCIPHANYLLLIASRLNRRIFLVGKAVKGKNRDADIGVLPLARLDRVGSLREVALLADATIRLRREPLPQLRFGRSKSVDAGQPRTKRRKAGDVGGRGLRLLWRRSGGAGAPCRFSCLFCKSRSICGSVVCSSSWTNCGGPASACKSFSSWGRCV